MQLLTGYVIHCRRRSGYVANHDGRNTKHIAYMSDVVTWLSIHFSQSLQRYDYAHTREKHVRGAMCCHLVHRKRLGQVAVGKRRNRVCL